METSRLKALLDSGEQVNLGNLFEYLHGTAEGLGSVTRWDYRASIAGQSVTEDDLQHSYKTALLTLFCAVEENKYRCAKDLLDLGLLCTMALVHDMGEISEGDICRLHKNSTDSEQELRAFERIVAPLPKSVKGHLTRAFRHAVRGIPCSIDSQESRFFNAVEKIGFLKRGLHECRLGNLNFAPKCLETEIAALQRYVIEFPSLRHWYEPYINEAMAYVEAFKQHRDDYLRAFIERGGKEENFLF